MFASKKTKQIQVIQKQHCFILVLLLLISTHTFGQARNNTSIPHSTANKEVSKQVFRSKNIMIFAGLLGGALITDQWLNERMQENHNKIFSKYTNLFNEFGEKKYIVPATIATWAIGTISKDEQLSTTAFNSIKALMIGAIATEGIKIISGRSRPYMQKGSYHFDFLGGTNNRKKSFPSGHAFVAWAAFTPFAETYGKWLYAIPISVSLARAYKNKHWVSDVILGGGLGFFAGMYFHQRKNQRILFSGNGIVIKF